MVEKMVAPRLGSILIHMLSSSNHQSVYSSNLVLFRAYLASNGMTELDLDAGTQ